MAILFISIILILLSLYIGKSKIIYIADFFWLFIVMGYAGNGLADRSIYIDKYLFYNEWASATEYAFNQFMIVCHNFSLDFQRFVLIYTIIFLLILFVAISHLTKNYCTVMGLYMIFFFVMDAAQLRFAMAGAILVLALSALYKKEKKLIDYIIYILLVLVAAGFHFSALFFLAFLFLPKLSTKKCIVISIVMAFIGVYAINSGFANAVLRTFLGGKGFVIRNDYGLPRRIFTAVRMILIFLQYYIFCRFERKYNLYHVEASSGLIERKDLMTEGLNMNILILAAIGLLPFAIDWYRVQQPILIFDYCIFASCLRPTHKGFISKENIKLETINALYCFLNLYLLVLESAENINAIIKPLLYSNKLIP